MVNVFKNAGNTIYYKCDCGTVGRCMIKPLNKGATIVVDICCAVCSSTERVTLLQYSSNKEKEKLLEDLNEAELSWTLILSNEVVKEEQ